MVARHSRSLSVRAAPISFALFTVAGTVIKGKRQQMSVLEVSQTGDSDPFEEIQLLAREARVVGFVD